MTVTFKISKGRKKNVYSILDNIYKVQDID